MGGDHRDQARYDAAHPWYVSLDVGRMLATVEYPEPEPEDPGVEWHEDAMVTMVVPFHYVVCQTCEGRGSHVNPDIDRQGLSSEDFAEDPDFRDSYFDGSYDVTCYGCSGRRVVPEPVLERFTPEQRAAWDAWEERLADDAREAYADAQTMRWESGGY